MLAKASRPLLLIAGLFSSLATSQNPPPQTLCEPGERRRMDALSATPHDTAVQSLCEGPRGLLVRHQVTGESVRTESPTSGHSSEFEVSTLPNGLRIRWLDANELRSLDVDTSSAEGTVSDRLRDAAAEIVFTGHNHRTKHVDLDGLAAAYPGDGKTDLAWLGVWVAPDGRRYRIVRGADGLTVEGLHPRPTTHPPPSDADALKPRADTPPVRLTGADRTREAVHGDCQRTLTWTAADHLNAEGTSCAGLGVWSREW